MEVWLIVALAFAVALAIMLLLHATRHEHPVDEEPTLDTRNHLDD